MLFTQGTTESITNVLLFFLSKTNGLVEQVFDTFYNVYVGKTMVFVLTMIHPISNELTDLMI